MIVNVLSDGSTVASVEGFVVPRTAARLAYEVMQRMNEGGKHEEENEEQGLEGDNVGGCHNVDNCGVCA